MADLPPPPPYEGPTTSATGSVPATPAPATASSTEFTTTPINSSSSKILVGQTLRHGLHLYRCVLKECSISAECTLRACVLINCIIETSHLVDCEAIQSVLAGCLFVTGVLESCTVTCKGRVRGSRVLKSRVGDDVDKKDNDWK